jgi:hypothetical protein
MPSRIVSFYKNTLEERDLMTLGLIILFVWGMCAVINLVYCIKAKEIDLSDENNALAFFLLGVLIAPMGTILGVMGLLHELNKAIREQSEDEIKEAKFAKKASKTV